jgi:hypothetical protein
MFSRMILVTHASFFGIIPRTTVQGLAVWDNKGADYVDYNIHVRLL